MTQKTVSSGVIACSGITQNIYNYTYSASNLFDRFAGSDKKVVTKTSDVGVAFGTGSTPPTLNDYWLSGDHITTISIVATTVTSNIADGVYTIQNAMTVSNSGADTITINEMALCAQAYVNTGGNYVSTAIDRTVLDTPLTLAPGEQGVITYTFNLPIVQ